MYFDFINNICYNLTNKENLNMSIKYFIFECLFIYFQIKLNNYKGGKKIMTGWKENNTRVER